MYGEFDENRPGVTFELIVSVIIIIIVLLLACNQEDSPSKKAQDQYKELKEKMDKDMEKLDK